MGPVEDGKEVFRYGKDVALCDLYILYNKVQPIILADRILIQRDEGKVA
jgi:hypothetical protein